MRQEREPTKERQEYTRQERKPTKVDQKKGRNE